TDTPRAARPIPAALAAHPTGLIWATTTITTGAGPAGSRCIFTPRRLPTSPSICRSGRTGAVSRCDRWLVALCVQAFAAVGVNLFETFLDTADKPKAFTDLDAGDLAGDRDHTLNKRIHLIVADHDE